MSSCGAFLFGRGERSAVGNAELGAWGQVGGVAGDVEGEVPSPGGSPSRTARGPRPVEALAGWAGGRCALPGSPGRTAERPLGWTGPAPLVCGSRRRTGSGWPRCRRLFRLRWWTGRWPARPDGPCIARRVSPGQGGSGLNGGVVPGVFLSGRGKKPRG